MPGSYGYTGQHADALTGLDYYNARYYDPVAGQFASADTADAGLNRYAYVGGNPETASDPTGHMRCFGDGPGGCGGPTPAPPPAPTPTPPPSGGGSCHSDATCDGGYGGPTTTTTTTTSGCGCALKPPPNRDNQGRCLNYHTCDSDRAAAASALRYQAESDKGRGWVLILVGKIISGWGFLLASDLTDAVKEWAEAAAGFAEGVIPLIASVFGPDSAAEAVAKEAVQVLNVILAAASAYQGLLWLGSAVLTVIQGPASLLMKVVGLLVGAVAEGGAAYGFWLLTRANDEYDQADAIGGETTGDWCKQSDKCAPGWDKAP